MNDGTRVSGPHVAGANVTLCKFSCHDYTTSASSCSCPSSYR
jgi:hypothetical protein